MTEDRGQVIVEDNTLREGFVVIPVAFLQCPDIGAAAKLAYGILLWYAWRGKGYPGHDQAAKEFGLAGSSLRRHLSELKRAGFIEVKQQGLGQTNSYYIKSLSGLVLKSEQSGCSKVSSQGAQKWAATHNNDIDSVLDSKTNTKGIPFSSLSQKDQVITALTDTFAPGENGKAIGKHLSKFTVKQLQRGGDITQQANGIQNEIAYLYGVLAKLKAAEPGSPIYHQPAPTVEPLSAAEYEAGLAALDAVTKQLVKQGLIRR